MVSAGFDVRGGRWWRRRLKCNTWRGIFGGELVKPEMEMQFEVRWRGEDVRGGS